MGAGMEVEAYDLYGKVWELDSFESAEAIAI